MLRKKSYRPIFVVTEGILMPVNATVHSASKSLHSMVRAACTQAPGGVIHTEGGDGGGAKAEARDTTSNVERNATQTHTQRTYNRGFRQNTLQVSFRNPIRTTGMW